MFTACQTPWAFDTASDAVVFAASRQQGVQPAAKVILGEVLQEPGAAANPHGRGACPIAEHPDHRLTKTRPILRIDDEIRCRRRR